MPAERFKTKHTAPCGCEKVVIDDSEPDPIFNTSGRFVTTCKEHADRPETGPFIHNNSETGQL